MHFDILPCEPPFYFIFFFMYAQKRHGWVRPAIGAFVRPWGCTTERAASAATKAATRVAIKDAGRDFTNPDERVAHPDLRCAPAVPVPGVTFTVLRARTAKATASRHGTRTPQRREARTEQRLVSPPPGKERMLRPPSANQSDAAKHVTALRGRRAPLIHAPSHSLDVLANAFLCF